MNTKHSLSLLLVACALAGCDNKPAPAPPQAALPEVNDENCKNENIAKLDPAIRQPFADACFRSGTHKPSTGRTW